MHFTSTISWIVLPVTFAVLLAIPGYGEQAHAHEALTVKAGQSRMIRLDRTAGSVFIAEPAVLDVQVPTARVLFLLGKAVGRTSLAVLDDDGEVVGEWTVTVSVDMGPVRAALSRDPEYQNVKVRPWRQGVEVRGVVASPKLVEGALQLARASVPENTVVINRLSVSGPQQVNLEVQIAEVQRSVTESLGINWQAIDTQGKGLFGLRVGSLLRGNLLNLPGAVFPEGQAATAFGSYTGGSTSVRGLIDALASAGLATVLARPNITAVSGESASFFSGGEYPLPSGVDDGEISFDYKKYGVLLDFVPTVIDSDRISLTVRPEVSQRSGTDALRILNAEIPVIDVRRAETTIEVGNGESIVIAGLYRNQTDSTEAGVPELKDIPVLGRLFGARTTRANSTELIVAVTARLIASKGAPSEDTEAPVATRRVQGYHY